MINTIGKFLMNEAGEGLKCNQLRCFVQRTISMILAPRSSMIR